MMWLLLSIIGLLMVALMGMGLFYGERMRQARIEEKAEHARCMALVASVVSHRIIAQAFRFAATEWDAIEEKPTIDRLMRKHSPSGPSVPAMWLLDRADRMEEFAEHQSPFHTLSGERVL